MGETIVYLNGGDTYIGRIRSHGVRYWMDYGRSHRQTYLYMGWYAYEGGTPVVVFDTKRWSSEEVARRKANGFVRIKYYPL